MSRPLAASSRSGTTQHAFTVSLEGGSTFVFDVQDWEDDTSSLDDAVVLGMANGLVREGVELYGTLYMSCASAPGRPGVGASRFGVIEGCTRIDHDRIVNVMITPTGIKP